MFERHVSGCYIEAFMTLIIYAYNVKERKNYNTFDSDNARFYYIPTTAVDINLVTSQSEKILVNA